MNLHRRFVMLDKKSIKKELERGSIYVEGGMEQLELNSILVTLGDTVKVYDAPYLDLKNATSTREFVIPEEGFILKPNELYIGRTQEFTKTYGFVPLLSGLEELAAIGMEVHVTAGFGDNGFEGTWTLEIVCSNPTRVYKGMPVGRLYYYPLIGDADIEYRGKYYRQIDPTASKLNEEYSKEKGLVRERVNKKRN